MKNKMKIMGSDPVNMEKLDSNKMNMFFGQELSNHDNNYGANIYKITSDITREHADWIGEDRLHPEFMEFFKIMYAEPSRIRFDNIKDCSNCVRHVIGLVDLTLKLQDMRVSTGWSFPETYMHPSMQLDLGDLAIKIFDRKIVIQKQDEQLLKIK